uniref:Reverse transcriptase Ty1/copia-type domain-containing protein n=1 Tax=Peronospora matthiolae TaxID=2874970 RepID=A0AAV1U6Z2_9STRA
MSSVRLFFALSSLIGLRLTHGDVPNAYMKGLLHELIYMKSPRELGVEAGKVLKLLKPLYGLKQSVRCWNGTMNENIITLGFINSRLDPCIYYKRGKKERVMFLGLYVDDVLIAFHDEEELHDVTLNLEERYSIKMLGPVKKFLGIAVHETSRSNYLSRA